MISIESKIVTESTVKAGVTFTVKTLNSTGRARRDFPIAEHLAEYSFLIEEYRSLFPKGWTELQQAKLKVASLSVDLENPDIADDARATKEAELAQAKEALRVTGASVADTPENEKRRRIVDFKAGLIRSQYMVPAYVRAGLVSITGLEIDGKPATADSLLESTGADYDALIEEIYAACEQASGLTGDQRKNSESPTTSSAQVVTEATTSSVTSAGN
jgi:hypothetical protein